MQGKLLAWKLVEKSFGIEVGNQGRDMAHSTCYGGSGVRPICGLQRVLEDITKTTPSIKSHRIRKTILRKKNYIILPRSGLNISGQT